MVKLTYGGNLSVDSADDSGNIADESEVGELETRWDALMTSFTVGLFLKVLTGLPDSLSIQHISKSVGLAFRCLEVKYLSS